MKKIIIFAISNSLILANNQTLENSSDVSWSNQQKQKIKDLLNQFDLESIENDIKEKVQKEFMEKNLKKELEDAIQEKIDVVTDEQVELGKKWLEVRKYQKEQWDEFNKLKVKQKLSDLMNSFSDYGEITELWRDISKNQMNQTMDKMVINMDMAQKIVKVQSAATDEKQKPLYEWWMDTNSGQVTEIIRDSTSSKMYEKFVDPKYLNHKKYEKEIKEDEQNLEKDESPKPIVKSSMTEYPQDALEMQRDIAFKIIYFFVGFICTTFSLVYIYFQLAQQETRKQQIPSRKVQLDDEITSRRNPYLTSQDQKQFLMSSIKNPDQRSAASPTHYASFYNQ